jgi:hypothetical protein
MTIARGAGLILLFSCLLNLACQKANEPLATVQAPATSDVSLLQLIATPAAYDRKAVRVIGFCHLEFEGNGLYLHREDFDRAISKNAIWIDAPRDKAALSDQYVLIEATFDAGNNGHMGAFSGRLKDITRMERWPSHKDFEKATQR